mmetsp:Transcript_52144/g.97561  ORF Transcript_52144/g.97561 Transcript_52144/m.97561 type:complete len:364 (+) Transcript_52144:41-1132(+)
MHGWHQDSPFVPAQWPSYPHWPQPAQSQQAWSQQAWSQQALLQQSWSQQAFAHSPIQAQSCGPEQFQWTAPTEPLEHTERRLHPHYHLLDAAGNPKAFSDSRVSQQSGAAYEGSIRQMIGGTGPHNLYAVHAQQPHDWRRLNDSKHKVATFLEWTVSGMVARAVRDRGIPETQMEIDVVVDGTLINLAERVIALQGKVLVAGCGAVDKVLVEVCSDSRFAAMKLWQIECQYHLLERQAYLVRGDKRQQLSADRIGFAIVMNRAALGIDVNAIAQECQLHLVEQLLEAKRLQLVYFATDYALPAALQIATAAKEEAAAANAKAAAAEEEAAAAKEEAKKINARMDELAAQLKALQEASVTQPTS